MVKLPHSQTVFHFIFTVTERCSLQLICILTLFHQRINMGFSSNFVHLLVCSLIEVSFFCFYVDIDQQCHLLLILPLQYHV